MTVALVVDRMSLRIPGITEEDGRLLAQRVGELLAAAPPPAAGRAIGSMALSLEARPGEPLDATAVRIAAAMRRGIGEAP